MDNTGGLRPPSDLAVPELLFGLPYDPEAVQRVALDVFDISPHTNETPEKFRARVRAHEYQLGHVATVRLRIRTKATRDPDEEYTAPDRAAIALAAGVTDGVFAKYRFSARFSAATDDWCWLSDCNEAIVPRWVHRVVTMLLPEPAYGRAVMALERERLDVLATFDTLRLLRDRNELRDLVLATYELGREGTGMNAHRSAAYAVGDVCAHLLVREARWTWEPSGIDDRPTRVSLLVGA